jgi:hypothetical protein
MFNSDLTANRPAAGIVGRIFIAIDSPYGIFRDTGTAWDQISSAGGGATIYTGDGTLTGTRTISSGGFQLVFNPQTTFFSSLIPSTSASSFAVLGSNTLTFAAGFSSSNIGNVYSANGAINAQIFSGDATFAQANLASAMVNVNKIDFSSGGHTITMTQSTAPGIRAMTGTQNQIQFTGSHNGRITHAAVSQNLGFFRDTGSSSTLTITNAYSHLINPLDDYGSGFTFTNRWGIYQAGASDKNYFAANVLLGTTTDSGQRLQVQGTTLFNGTEHNFTNTNSFTPTLGVTGHIFMTATFAPTSGNGQYYELLINPTINQTGGANGITRGLYVNPTLTASSDWRSIEWSNNSGWGLFGAGTCQNYLNGSLGIGSTDNLYKLDVFGNARFLRSQNNATTLRVENATAGTAAQADIRSFNDLGDFFSVGIYSSTTTTYGPISSRSAFNYTAAPNGIAFMADNGTGSMRFATGGNSERMRLTAAGRLLLGTTTENNSAILNLTSTAQGFLPPRMTNADRTSIGTPAVGLIVYCTDAVEGLYIYKSTGWTFVI